LGTKEFWDAAYTKEVNNFKSHKDIGEVWFGEESMDRVMRYIEESDEISESSSVLDIGSGNGIFLIELACAGYSQLTGIDYSESAVQLARLVAADREAAVTFQTADLLAEEAAPACLLRQYDVCHDKGTYDAVSLSPEQQRQQRLRYIERVRRLLRPGGLFIVTSCNWTDAELRAHFCPALRHEHTIPTPSFSFAGSSGSMVSSVVFRRPD